jgi:hypothetical protein
MLKSIPLFSLAALLYVNACGHSVPPPDASPAIKAHHCDKISQDQTVGCKACAGFAFCGWKQTTGPTTGTCEFLEDVHAPPPGVIGDPTHCPVPPE